jgi:hypothetical protein
MPAALDPVSVLTALVAGMLMAVHGQSVRCVQLASGAALPLPQTQAHAATAQPVDGGALLALMLWATAHSASLGGMVRQRVRALWAAALLAVLALPLQLALGHALPVPLVNTRLMASHASPVRMGAAAHQARLPAAAVLLGDTALVVLPVLYVSTDRAALQEQPAALPVCRASTARVE